MIISSRKMGCEMAMPTNKINYALVMENMPNSFEPIKIYDDLKNLDQDTAQYDKIELKSFLVKNNFINAEDNIDNLQIIFSDNGIRRIKEGLIFKDKANDDMAFYVINFIYIFKKHGNLINEIYQYINNKKTISDECKNDLRNIVETRKNEDVNSFNENVNKLTSLPYYDIRTIYLFIINVLIAKVDSKNIQIEDAYRLKRTNKSEEAA